MAETEKLLIHKTFKKCGYMYRWVGMNVESKKRTGCENIKYKMLYTFNVLIVCKDIVCCTMGCLEDAKINKNVDAFAYTIPGVIIMFLGHCKTVWFMVFENDVNNIRASLKKLETIENRRESDFKRANIIKKEIKFLHKFLKLYTYLHTLLIISFSLAPLIKTLVNYLKTNEILLVLPLFTACPSNATDLKYWPFMFIIMSYSGMITNFECCGSDCFFFITSTYIRIQFLLLNYEIDNIIGPNETNEKFYQNVQFNDELNKLIRRHQEIHRLVKLLEKLYTASNLFNIGCSSMIICFVAFNIMTIQDQMSFFMVLLFTCSLQTFALCLFGDMLKTSSMKVSDAVYNCRWYLADASITRKLSIIQVRAQTPSKVTAYGFVDFDLILFSTALSSASQQKLMLIMKELVLFGMKAIAILSTSWSYFTFLNNVYGER